MISFFYLEYFPFSNWNVFLYLFGMFSYFCSFFMIFSKIRYSLSVMERYAVLVLKNLCFFSVSNTSIKISPTLIRKLDTKTVICTEKRHKIRISLVKAFLPILDFQVEDSHWKIVVNAFLRLRFHAIMVVVYGVMKRPKSESQPCMIDF